MGNTAIILAGGRSSRFGGDKTFIEINGRNIVEEIAEKCKPVFSDIIIVGKRDFHLPGIRNARDIFKDAGPLAGIHAGLIEAANESCFVVACDMPNFSIELAKELLDASKGYEAVVPRAGGRLQPLFAIYSRGIIHKAEKMLRCNNNRLSELLASLNTLYYELEEAPKSPLTDVFFNINRKEDYDMLEKARKSSVPPVLSVVGYSGSGKTTYLEKLIPALKSRGFRVGVIKHDSHSFEIDIPGKDSRRLTEAGAHITVISSPEKLAVIEKRDAEEGLWEIASRLSGKVDIVLTEGYKRDKALKILIRRAGAQQAECPDSELFAIASDYKDVASVPVLPLDDPEPMVDLIVSFVEGGAK